MLTKAYARGLLLWIDDNLHGHLFPSNMWSNLFGNYSNRVLRLMDLSLEVAASYSEAIEIIEGFDHQKEAGTFVYCVVDLMIPSEFGSVPALRYGIALAKELHKRDIPFAFLSANTGGATVLSEEYLSAVPYYIKEPGSIWRFPDSLTLKVAGEFRRHVSWVSTEAVITAIHESSDIRSTFRQTPDAFRYFPFFGPWREFVERCEYRTSLDIPKAAIVRSTSSHCDEFIQQAVSIILYSTLFRRREQMKVVFGHAHSHAYLDRLSQTDFQKDPDTIALIRVDPNRTTIIALKGLINIAGRNAGRTLFILPNDESAEEYTEYLREFRVLAIEELPQMRVGDSAQREEMLRQGSTMVLQQWVSQQSAEHPVVLHEESFNYPEFIINPIDWTILLETFDITEALSDPYEIVFEFYRALKNVSEAQEKSILTSLATGQPLSYEHLLKVGRNTFLASEFKDNLSNWIERTLETWLKTSRQSPYGILERRIRSPRLQLDQMIEESDLYEKEIWQDACFEILVEIIREYQRYRSSDRTLTPAHLRLQPIIQFVNALGGNDFLSDAFSKVNWADLATIRWPHRHYPMPSAVISRLREAKRFLWIQPDGLDLALTLPAGRLRYRMLASTIDQYWSVLNWAKQIVPRLPLGWRYSVSQMINVIASNQIQEAWEDTPEMLWQALLGLLRNGGPIMFITDQLAQGKPINRGSESIKNSLSKIHGYGPILNRLRKTRARRVTGYLKPNFNNTMELPDILSLHHLQGYLSKLSESGEDHLHEMETALRELAKMFGNIPVTAMENSNEIASVSMAYSDYLSDSNLHLTDSNGWFIDDLDQVMPDHADFGELPSLFGTKIDHLWQLINLYLHLDNVTRRYRYYDGYHLLSSIHDLRLENKDTRAQVPVAVIETIADLFIASLEGLVAQLSWCVKLTGHDDLADGIAPSNIEVCPTASFKQPSERTLNSILRVTRTDDDWEVFTLGIPGKGTVSGLCYHDGEYEDVKKYSP